MTLRFVRCVVLGWIAVLCFVAGTLCAAGLRSDHGQSSTVSRTKSPQRPAPDETPSDDRRRVVSSFDPLRASARIESHVAPPREIALSQRVRFERLTMDEGLSHDSVSVVVEDRRGFMWLGTDDGLNRFDGHELTVFRQDPRDSNSLGGNHIDWVHEDSNGILWVAHAPTGVTRFDPIHETFTRYRHSPTTSNSLAGDLILRVVEDSVGRIWLSGPPTRGGLTLLDDESQTFTRLEMHETPAPTDYRGGVIWDWVQTPDEHLWMAADFRVEEYDPKSGEFTHYEAPGEERRLSAVVQGRDGELWAAGFNGIYGVDRLREELTLQSHLSLNRVFAMNVDDTGQFWIGTDSGLYVLDRRMQRVLHHYTHDPSDDSTLPSSRVRHLFRSRSGLLWVATRSGVATFHASRNRFSNFVIASDRASDGAASRDLSADPDGVLWLTHGEGIARVDLETSSALIFEFPTQAGEPVRQVEAVHADTQGGVWFSRGERVHRLVPSRKRLDSYSLPRQASPTSSARVPPTGPPRQIRAIAEDTHGTIWIAAIRAGLFTWDKGSRELSRFDPGDRHMAETGPPDPGPLSQASAVYLSPSETMWVGTDNGDLFGIDPEERKITTRLSPSAGELPSSAINTILEDRRGTLWLGTRSGLVRVSTSTGAEGFALYGHRDGLESPDVESLIEDAEGYLWLGTRKGLVRFHPQTGQGRSFDERDGLSRNAFSEGAWRSPSGHLAFTTADGLSLFQPRSLLELRYEPPLVLMAFHLLYEPQRPGGGVLSRPIWETSSINLDHHQNVFGFEFGNLDYMSPQKNRYRYRLDDFDDEWHEVNATRRFASYTHVPPGSYRFRVQSADASGLWNTNDTAVQVVIRQPWWMTLWARGGLVFGIALGIFGWQRVRFGQVRRHNQELEQKVIERTAALQDAIHRLELAATTDPLTGLPNRRAYLERARQELAKLKRTDRVMTVALADIDDFKKVNDSYGHDLGDRVLERVSELLRSQVREQDIVARWGGEEFILLFPETEQRGASVVAEKIRSHIEESYFTFHGKTVRLTLSIGLAENLKDQTIEDATARADAALYEGKRRGKNCVVTYSASMSERAGTVS